MKKTTITGLEEKWEILLIYIFSILGFIFSFIKDEKVSEDMRFHYNQAGALWLTQIILTIASTVISNTGIPVIGIGCSLLSLVLFVFAIITIVKGFSNEKFEIPVISNLASSIWK